MKGAVRPGLILVDEARKFGLDQFHGDREAMTEAAETARKEVGAKIGDAWEKADAQFLGVKKDDLVSAIRDTAKKYDSPVEAPIRKQIEALAKETEQWGVEPSEAAPKQSWTDFLKGKMGPAMKEHGSHGAALKALSEEYRGASVAPAAPSNARIPLADVNKLAGKLESVGFASADVTPGSAKQIQRDLAKNVNDVLDKRLADIQEYADHMGSEPNSDRGPAMTAASDAIKGLRELNRDYRGLKMISRMNSELASVPPANRAAGGLRNAVNGAVDMGILFHNPLAYVAKKGGEKLIHTVGRGADEILAKIGRAARAGDSTSRYIQQAIEAGIPRSAIATAVASNNG